MTCPNCNEWEIGLEDRYCSACKHRLIRLGISEHTFEVFRGSSTTQIPIIFSNNGDNPVHVELFEEGGSNSTPGGLTIQDPTFDIAVGEQKEISLAIDSEKFPSEGRIELPIVIKCNDPECEQHYLTVIIEDPPEPVIDSSDVDFGIIETNIIHRHSITIFNKGGGRLRLKNSIYPEDSLFHVSLPQDPTAVTGGSIKVEIVAEISPDYKGFIEEEIKLKFERIDEETVLKVTAEVVNPPELMMSQDVLDLREIPRGRSRDFKVFLKNCGNSQLVINKIDFCEEKKFLEIISDLPLIIEEEEEESISFFVNTTQLTCDNYDTKIQIHSNCHKTPQREVALKFNVIELQKYNGFIGIDFGTTNSCIAVMGGDGQPKILDIDGSTLIPSMVFFKKRPRVSVIGKEAEENAVVYPERVCRSIKRVMGRRKLIKIGGQEYLPHQIAGIVIKKLIDKAEDELNKHPTLAIVTVPANFYDTQIRATIEACQEAGLEIVQNMILDEPSAAAIYYLMLWSLQGLIESLDEYFLVYDFGGGTLDVSLLKVVLDQSEKGCSIQIDVKAVRGDNRLGGDDFDDLLIKRFAETIKEEYASFNTEILDKSDTEILKEYGDQAPEILTQKQKFKESAERMKINLSEFDTHELTLDYFLDNKLNRMVDEQDRYLEFKISMTREEFEALIRGKIERSLELIDQCCDIEKISREQIDCVLMTGRTCLIPLIRKLVEDHCPQSKIECGDPKICVAMGAAILGNLSVMPGLQLGFGQKGRLIPYHYGLVEAFLSPKYPRMQRFAKIIEAGTPYPTSLERVYENVSGDLVLKVVQNMGNDDRMFIRKEEGEEIIPNPDIRNLGSYRIKKTGEKCIVEFKVDDNRKLSVYANEELVPVQYEEDE